MTGAPKCVHHTSSREGERDVRNPSPGFIGDDSALAALTLVISGLAGGLDTLLSLEATSERHGQTSWRYKDLVSDLEEILCKERRFRPRCDVTMQRLKMQADNAERTAPPLAGAPRVPSGDSMKQRVPASSSSSSD